MKQNKIFLIILWVTFVWFLNYTSLLIGAGIFDFNDGTTQGWTLDQMYVTSDQTKFTPVIGYTLMNSNNQLLAYSGSLLIGRSDQNDIYLESPDLSSNSNWQGIGGYSIDVTRLLYSPAWGDLPNIFFVQFQLRVIDTADNNKEKLFAESDGSNFVFHEIRTYGKLYQFTWQPSWLTDPRYKVKKIRIRITGPGEQPPELWLRGSWNIDNVIAIGGSTSNNTNPGSNVQINLGGGVDVTFDQVTGAGNTLLTTSGSGTPPPGGFTLVPIGSPTYYSITTTATFTGNIKIAIQYSDASLSAPQEAALNLRVYETTPGQWRNITSSINTTTNIIYGTVTHLSEFAVMFFSGGALNEWVLTNNPSNGINCFAVNGNNLYAGTEGGGVFKSTNNGVSWRQMNNGLTNLVVRALWASGTNLFAGTWGDGVFLSTATDTVWKPINTGLTEKTVTTFYSSGTNLLAGTWGGVYLSANNGSSWTTVNTGITDTHIRAVYISGTSFFAGSINGLFRSTNNGASWTAINSGLTSTNDISMAGIPISGGEKLFIGTATGGVCLSLNNGDLWTGANTGLTTLHVPFLVTNANNLFAATWGGGFFMTTNDGTSWTSANQGLTNLFVRSLIISGTDIFAGTSDGGIWRRALSTLILAGPDIAADPASWNYGSVAVGNNLDKTFVIKNEGTADLNVTGTTLTGANALEFSIQTGGGSFTLAPAATRNIVIKFAPTGAGSKSASLSISSNDPDENPFLVSLSGTGTSATAPDISSNPATWNYGAINVGANSDKTFTIKNDGNANLNVTATSLTGANAAEFSIQSSGGAFTLAPAATRDIIVRFAPTSAGSKSASLSISSNDPDENPFVVALSGSGTAVAGVPINPVTASPQMAGIEFWVSIDVGTNANPVTDLFGVSFVLNYTNTAYINYVAAEAGSFIGSGALFYPTPDDPNGKVSIGISRMAPQTGVNGFGTVARVKLIADAATPNNTPIQLSITNVTANNSTGAPIALIPGSLNITIQAGLIVWPGDTNNNGNVDQADILPLGLHWGKTGPARANASMAWSGQLAMFWTPQSATYADANGDGTVNQADVLPIGLNWNKTHTTVLLETEPSPTPMSKELLNAKLVIADSGNTEPNQDFYIDIMVNQVSNLFGLSYELIYTPALIIEPLTAETGPANLLGSDVIFFSIINKTAGVDTGKVSVGISRKFGQGGVSGSGRVTRIKAHMAANAVNHFSATLLTLTRIQANDPNGTPIPIDSSAFKLVTDIQNDVQLAPTGFALHDNYPNPFNLATTIAFHLPQPANVSLSIYDLQGHRVRTLVHGDISAGYHTIPWNGCDERGNVMASGVYFVRLEARARASTQKSFVDSKKMILMK